jgi:RimJ/RimL family protein N-acetyltransferase
MPYPPPPSITLPDPWLVDGLRLRPPVPADVPAIVAACRDPEIQRFTRVPSPYVDADAEWFVADSQAQLGRGGAVRAAVAAVDGDDLLAMVGLELDHRDYTAELGYWVAPAARGRGVASTAGRALCRFGFATLGLETIHLWAADNNPGSNAVAARIGFHHAGMLPRAGADGPTGDRTAPRVDMNLWGLLPEQLIV